MIIKIKYMAIKMDNYQGASGMPFTGEIIMEYRDDANLIGLYDFAKRHLKNLDESHADFIEARNLIEVCIPDQLF